MDRLLPHQNRLENTKPSPRQLEILQMLAQGISQTDVAKHLGISRQTVKNHLYNLHLKMEVSGTTELLFQSLKLGYVTIEGFEDVRKAYDRGKSDENERIINLITIDKKSGNC